MPLAARKTDVSAAMIVRVNKLRKRRKWSEQRLADAMTATGYPISRSSVAAWSRNPNPAFTADQIMALSAAFEITLDHLFGIGWCDKCMNDPPAGFACSTCGLTTDT